MSLHVHQFWWAWLLRFQSFCFFLNHVGQKIKLGQKIKSAQKVHASSKQWTLCSYTYFIFVLIFVLIVVSQLQIAKY